ncbi:NTP transferase domain-containing protein [Acidobacteria bacterium AH-259-D05]|nr:NTP transferase domain-containing protein [Acidobacteria bacterium AH-259-D05]
MKGIVIGAGPGTRMMPLTENRPKCMLEVGGCRILEIILDSFKEGGIEDIVFIGGYQIDKVIRRYPCLRYHENHEWADNNILESFFYADAELDTGFVVTYSDIVFHARVSRRLIMTEADVVLVVDQDWRRRYKSRDAHPESEAEKVIVEDNRVVKIGKRLPPHRVQGEFIGLAKFAAAAASLMRDHYQKIRKHYLNQPFHEAPNIRRAYLTDMLQELIELGVRVEPMYIEGDWFEFDTVQDVELAQKYLRGQKWLRLDLAAGDE